MKNSIFVVVCVLLTLLSFSYADDSDDMLSYSESLQESYLKLQDLINLRDDLIAKKEKESEDFNTSRIYTVQLLVGLYRIQSRPPEMLMLQDIQPEYVALTYMSINEMIKILYNKLRDLAISLQTSYQLSKEIDALSKNAQVAYRNLEVLNNEIAKNPNLANNRKLKSQQLQLQKQIDSYYDNALDSTNSLASLSSYDKELSNSFKAERGKLLWPSSSEILYGYHQAPVYSQYYEGIAFSTEPVEEIKAPFFGEIIYFKVFEKYGYIVIIKHAPAYYSVLMGLEKIDVRLTQKVKTGEKIGTMPQKDGILLYSIKHGSESENPALWLKKR